MDKAGIIAKTRALMNEAGEEETLSLLSEDTVKLDVYIESVIPDAVNILSSMEGIDPMLLPLGSVQSVTIGEECSVIELPGDYIRFGAVRLSGWKREAQVCYPHGGEEYKIDHNPVTAPGVNKPSCVYAYSINGRCIECFPKGDLVYFKYVKRVGDSDVESALSMLDGRLFGALCYACASLVYNIFEMADQGKRMMEIALATIPTNKEQA